MHANLNYLTEIERLFLKDKEEKLSINNNIV